MVDKVDGGPLPAQVKTFVIYARLNAAIYELRLDLTIMCYVTEDDQNWLLADPYPDIYDIHKEDYLLTYLDGYGIAFT